MSRRGVYLPRGFLMYGHLSLSCQVTRKCLKEYLKDTRRLVGLSAALTPVVIMIQQPPFPNEYSRGHVIRGFVTCSSKWEVSEQLSKTSIGGQLGSCEEINGSSVSEHCSKTSIGGQLASCEEISEKLVSEQLSKTSIGGQLESCEEINGSLVSEQWSKTSIGGQLAGGGRISRSSVSE
jgi:hypothetical protein